MKQDTDQMLLKSDITHHKMFVVPGYNNVNRGQPNMYFQNKRTVMNITLYLLQTASYVTEIAKENI